MATKYKNRKMISVTLSPDTIKQLELLAQEYHCNKSQTISNLIWNTAKGVDNNGSSKQKTITTKE